MRKLTTRPSAPAPVPVNQLSSGLETRFWIRRWQTSQLWLFFGVRQLVETLHSFVHIVFDILYQTLTNQIQVKVEWRPAGYRPTLGFESWIVHDRGICLRPRVILTYRFTIWDIINMRGGFAFFLLACRWLKLPEQLHLHAWKTTDVFFWRASACELRKPA